MLLQILDEGSLTDSHGRQVSFKNTIIILTSNIGARSILKPTRLGFGCSSDYDEENALVREQVTSALKSEFSPELLNRIDEVIIFNRLTKADTEKITELMLNEVKDLCREICIDINFSVEVIQYIATIGFSRENGARPLRRAITSFIENPLSDKILSGEIKKGDTVSAFLENDLIKFKQLNLV